MKKRTNLNMSLESFAAPMRIDWPIAVAAQSQFGLLLVMDLRSGAPKDFIGSVPYNKESHTRCAIPTKSTADSVCLAFWGRTLRVE